MSKRPEFNTLTNPCMEGIPEYVASRQCFFCDYATDKGCDKGSLLIQSYVPHGCDLFHHEKNQNVYQIVRLSDVCRRCGVDIGFKVPVDNGVEVNGKQYRPICENCERIIINVIENQPPMG